jgi:hypothetical protein
MAGMGRFFFDLPKEYNNPLSLHLFVSHMATIQVFGRVRPPRRLRTSQKTRKTADYTILNDEKELQIRGKGVAADFKFNGKVFRPSSTQEDIFDDIAEPVVESVLQGYAKFTRIQFKRL